MGTAPLLTEKIFISNLCDAVSNKCHMDVSNLIEASIVT